MLRSKRYRVLSGISDVVTARRGPWPEGVSLLYHIALAIGIIGFIVSALHAFEGDVTLYPGVITRPPGDAPSRKTEWRATRSR